MGGGFDRKPGGATLVQQSQSSSKPGIPGKRTLTEQLAPPMPAAFGRGADTDAAVQPKIDHGYGDIVAAAATAPVQRLAGAAAPESDAIAQAAAQGVSGAGGRLPHAETIQRAFGRHDVSEVQAHVGGDAATASRAIGAEAYATGHHVAFAGSPSLHTAAHEAAHVVQQRGGVQLKGGVGEAGDAHEQHANAVADKVVRGESAEGLLDRYSWGSSNGSGHASGVQRYESGEHAKIGDTHEQLAKAYAPIQYVVVKGDTVDSIAKKFSISPEEIKKANHDKLKKFPSDKDHAKMVEGFAAGDQIAVPQKLNDMARDAIKDTTVKVTVNGVVLDYGTLIAMGGDLFESPEDLAKASPEELKALAALIEEEKRTGKPISTDRWQAATKGRYIDLAAKNEPHFAPPNADLVPVSGKSGADHKASWEANHRKALNASRGGNKDNALMLNAFGDHFLTDAFSAGHLFNKRDVMEKFNNQLPTKGQGTDREFTGSSEKFFDAIAQVAFVGNVATEFSKYETVETHYGFHPSINSPSRFSTLLQGIHLEKPDLLESAVALGVHNKLNTYPGGVAVANAVGDTWSLSGDGTLNAQSMAIAQKAVAQSQQNVIGVFRSSTEPDYPALFKRVWDYTPRPNAEGKKEIVGAVATGTDVNNKELQSTIVNLLNANYRTIIAELVKLKKLRLG